MAVKGAYNIDEFEDYLNEVEESGKTPKLFNRKIFKAAMVALLQLEILIFFMSSDLIELETPIWGFITHGLAFDWQFWWNAQILEIVPIINAGFNATTNFKMRRIRNKMVAENVKIIRVKDTQIGALQTQIDAQNFLIMEQKNRLDDQALLHDALSKANTLAEYQLIQKMLEKEEVIVDTPVVEATVEEPEAESLLPPDVDPNS